MSEKEVNNIHSSQVDIESATPMLRQFLEIKKQHEDVILLYRMGDFYETFLEDAVIAAKDLEITLTSREAGVLGRIPMAGIPVKAIENYIPKLLEKNHKIAICEQMEDPSASKGLVRREVVRTITAGTIVETNLLDSTKNNYLVAVFFDKAKKQYGLAYTDISTGEFKITQTGFENLMSELARIQPSEIIAIAKKQELKSFQILPETVADLPKEIRDKYNCTKINSNLFNENSAVIKIKECFNIQSLEGFGYPEYNLGICSAGAILHYLQETQKQCMPRFDTITPYSLEKFVSIDSGTRRNLELTNTVRDDSYKGSFFWAINKTATNMGARLLRKWIQQPLQNIDKIVKRQDAVEELLNQGKTRFELAYLLDKLYDVERLATKISNKSANARDFFALKESLKYMPDFQKVLVGSKSPYLKKINQDKTKIQEYCSILEKTIHENPPVGLKEGNLIKNGVHEQLDYYRELLTGGEKWLENFEKTEKETTGIKSLKVNYNKAFGYYIEITHSNVSLVPSNYIRKQTLSNAERYITEDLKRHEDEVLNAQSKAIELEYKIFCDLREYSNEFVTDLRAMAKELATLDVLLSFAQIAIECNYTRPEVDNSKDLIVVEGRHVVIEQLLAMGQYVPNDLKLIGGSSLNPEETQFMILTGPNMAGKSTFMRQNALIVILAQIGSFVPARAAKIGIVDKIFTRVGSVDDLSTGQSTFMVEMSETAYILNSATEKSLILLDEIGRGTSTYDGVAIAWSVSEYIVENIKARTIFATHYHELNIMCDKVPQIKNFRITISDNDGKIEFLRQVVPGGTSKSYGIQVAKMAGLPNQVISRAESLMNRMQKDYTAKLSSSKRPKDAIEINTPQLSFFVD
jgi:DNA mismatch repair protein MutS